MGTFAVWTEGWRQVQRPGDAGSLHPGEEGEFYSKHIAKLLKHFKQGTGVIDQIAVLK